MSKRRTFKQLENERLFSLRERLFSQDACLRMAESPYLDPVDVMENLHEPIRKSATSFFNERNIAGHGVSTWDASLTSSQVACVNCWYPFIDQPDRLKGVLSEILGDVDEMLPIVDECPLSGGSLPYLTFEWIDRGNRLKEPGRLVRGKYVTNVDILFHYRATDGSIKLVLTEWKYRECYAAGSVRYSDRGTDRLAFYLPHFDSADCQIRLPESVAPADLMYHPFDQLMRLQLLSSILQRDREMNANKVLVLCIAPRANTEFIRLVHSPKLKELFGNPTTPSVYDTWEALIIKGTFRHFATEDLVPLLAKYAPTTEYADYVTLRYGGIEDRILEFERK